MCRLRNIAMHDYQESVTTGQTDRWTDRQTDKVIPMCHNASQATQKLSDYMFRYYSIDYIPWVRYYTYGTWLSDKLDWSITQYNMACHLLTLK